MNDNETTGDNDGIPSAAEAVALAQATIKSEAPDDEPTEEPTEPESEPETPEDETEDDVEEEEQDEPNLTQADKKASDDPLKLKEVIAEQEKGVAKLKEKLQGYENLEAALADPARNVEIFNKMLEAAGLTVEDLTGEQWQGNESVLDRRLRALEQQNAMLLANQARQDALSKAETNLKAAIKTEHGFAPTREQIRQAMEEFPEMFAKNPAKAFKATHADLLIKHAKGQAQAPKKPLPTMVEGTGMPKEEAEIDWDNATINELTQAGLNYARSTLKQS